MANWNQPALTDTYANFLAYLNARDLDAAKGFDPAVVTVTNVPTGTIRWNSANTKWEKYSGTAWADLSATYAISISGNAATATSATSATSATTAGSATSATNAANAYVTDDVTTATNMYLLFAAGVGSNQGAKASSTKLTFKPSTGDVSASGVVNSSSDERLKAGWANLPMAFLAELACVKMGTYDRVDTGARQVGVSAQSLQAVLPDAVSVQDDGYLAVNYGNAALVSSIALAQEVLKLNDELALLKQEVKTLKGN